MDKKYIEENEIEIKYLRNQLSDKELEGFEVYLMENPETIDDLELDEILAINTPSSVDRAISFAGIWRMFSLRKSLAHIATYALGGASVLLLLPSLENNETMKGLDVNQVVYLTATRSSNDSVYAISIDKSTEPLSGVDLAMLIIDVDAPPLGLATIGLLSEDTHSLVFSREIEVTSQGEILFALPLTGLESENYKLEVKYIGATSEIIETFGIKLESN